MFWKKKKKKYFQEEEENVIENELDYWRIIEVSNPDPNLKDLIIRLRIEKPEVPDIKDYKTAIEIVWEFDKNESGMPNPEESEGFQLFEDLIEDLSCFNNLSMQVKITTGAGSRTWLYYSKDYDEFMEILNKRLKKYKFPIQISYYQDEEWKIWDEDRDVLLKSVE